MTAVATMGKPGVLPPGRNIWRRRRTIYLLRIVLPLMALALVATVFAWPHLMGTAGGLIAPIFANAEVDGTDVMLMRQARYVGQNDAAEPYEVTAETAYLDPTAPDRIHLDQLVADFATNGARGDVQLQAVNGLYHREADKLELSGGIEVRTEDGYEFRTESAKVNLDRGRVIGRQPVEGWGPAGQLAADRFEIRQSGDVMRFKGRVKLTILPGAGAGAAADVDVDADIQS